MNLSRKKLKMFCRCTPGLRQNWFVPEQFLNSNRYLSTNQFRVTQEVAEAVKNGEPVVALESTIITHGMPFPANLSMARRTEAIIREHGAVPATIAVLKGRVHVGLCSAELEYLASSTSSPLKISRRDFPFALPNQRDGGTTVSGTMVVAHRAGIQVFVTGGIGGVHRGAQTTMDISADLTELSRTPVLVVSAGVKSILDIGLTLEYLETMGVCVATLGDGNNFPAFYTANSGFRSPYTVKTPLEAARLIKTSLDLNLNTGVLLGVPIPVESEGNASIEQAIQQAVAETLDKNIVGKEITPYILARLNELTAGESLRANIALVENNAKVGAQIAVSLSSLNKKAYSGANEDGCNNNVRGCRDMPIVVGGCNFDFVVKMQEDRIEMNGSTHFGSLEYSHGGVGRNLADALARLGTKNRLVSTVGEDNQGSSILNSIKHLDRSLIKVLPDHRTATYTAFLDRLGECKFGVGDMEIHKQISREYILSLEDDISRSPLVVSDGNISEDSLDCLLEVCGRNKVPLFYEPTCPSKAVKPLLSKFSGCMTYSSPNLRELLNMARTLPGEQNLQDITEINGTTLKILADLSVRLLKHYGVSVLLLTMSRDGVLLTRRGSHLDPLPTRGNLSSIPTDRYSSVHYPGTPATRVVSVSGAGDCLTAGFIAAALQGLPQGLAVSAGMQAAKLSCGVSAAVPEKLSRDLIDWQEAIQTVIIL